MAGPAASEAPTLRQVLPLVSDLFRPRPALYFTDLLLTAGVGWGALVACGASPWGARGALSFAVAVLALYRGTAFIHEIVHLRPGAVPGFSTAWNSPFFSLSAFCRLSNRSWSADSTDFRSAWSA